MCAVHCLLTPIILVLLPVVATTFWVSENFHLWMLMFAIPTTALAIYAGCRKHKDRVVLALSALGLFTLSTVAAYEVVAFTSDASTVAHCAACAAAEAGSEDTFHAHLGINALGGFLLAAGHVRNFLLCRAENCSHEV